MSVDALHVLIAEASGFEPFAARIRRRNVLLAGAYDQLTGPHWTRCSTIATEIVKLRPLWRRHRFDNDLPPELTELQRMLFRSARIAGRLAPTTGHGVDAALKSTNANLNGEDERHCVSILREP